MPLPLWFSLAMIDFCFSVMSCTGMRPWELIWSSCPRWQLCPQQVRQLLLLNRDSEKPPFESKTLLRGILLLPKLMSLSNHKRTYSFYRQRQTLSRYHCSNCAADKRLSMNKEIMGLELLFKLLLNWCETSSSLQRLKQERANSFLLIGQLKWKLATFQSFMFVL